MKTLTITIEQAGALFEAIELASTLAHRTGDMNCFARFALQDLITSAVPEIISTPCTEEYKLANAIIPKSC